MRQFRALFRERGVKAVFSRVVVVVVVVCLSVFVWGGSFSMCAARLFGLDEREYIPRDCPPLAACSAGLGLVILGGLHEPFGKRMKWNFDRV